MYIVSTMQAIFVVHCWVNMKPFNRSQPSNLQIGSNPSTHHNFRLGVRGSPKILLPRVPLFVDQSVIVTLVFSTGLLLPLLENTLIHIIMGLWLFLSSYSWKRSFLFPCKYFIRIIILMGIALLFCKECIPKTSVLWPPQNFLPCKCCTFI